LSDIEDGRGSEMLDEYFLIYAYDDVYSAMTFEEYMDIILKVAVGDLCAKIEEMVMT
jgi:hypothetical protein